MVVVHYFYIAIIVLLLFGITILVHELGHFIAARWFGMVIDTFSIGFGPAIWKRKVNAIVYKIGCIPIGGYVSLPQMDPELTKDSETACASGKLETGRNSDQNREPLPRVAPWKKIIVALSGALGNVILAVLLAWIVYLVGKPSTPAERCTVIGFVETNSIAYKNGIRTGDEILAVNGRTVQNWAQVHQENTRFQQVTFTLKNPEGTISVCVPTEKNTLGIRTVAGLREITFCKIGAVEPDSSAEIAGLMAGDLIEKFDNVPVLGIEHLISLVSSRADCQVPICVERSGKLVECLVMPRLDPAIGRARIGIRFDLLSFDYDKVVHIPPSVQLRNHATAILRVVRSLLTPKEARATSRGLGGPFMIIFMIVDMAQKSFVITLWFMCFLNVNLAILNLLPIPILDGGHILFSLWELITRRPINPKIVGWISQVFAALLIGAVLLLSGRDVKRIYQFMHLSRPASIQEQTTNTVNSSDTGVTPP